MTFLLMRLPYQSRDCQEDGTWWTHPSSNRTWSNYTTCLDHDDFDFRSNVLLLGDVGNCLSLVFLLLALVIFTYNRSLHCGRNTVHINMFISIICSNISWLLWNHVVINNSDTWSDNPLWCRMFNSVMTYFTISTYFWMMCEGAYLQMVLFDTFDNDKSRLR